MDIRTAEERAAAEMETLRRLLFDYVDDKDRIAILEPVIQNVAWMKVKLDDAREAVKESSVVIAYDNGGGQKGLRENPLFKGYVSLFKAYMSGMAKILELIPPAEAKEHTSRVDKPKTVLEIVRTKRKGA